MNSTNSLFVERNKRVKGGKSNFASSSSDARRKIKTDMLEFHSGIQEVWKPKVFLSYVKDDKYVVDKIIAFLKQNGCKPWSCEYDLLPGQAWETEIKKKIEQSDFFIACLSKKYIEASGIVQIELKYAGKILEQIPEEKIFVIPIKLDDCKMPGSLSNRQSVNWRDLNAKPKILKAIQTWVG